MFRSASRGVSEKRRHKERSKMNGSWSIRACLEGRRGGTKVPSERAHSVECDPSPKGMCECYSAGSSSYRFSIVLKLARSPSKKKSMSRRAPLRCFATRRWTMLSAGDDVSFGLRSSR